LVLAKNHETGIKEINVDVKKFLRGCIVSNDGTVTIPGTEKGGWDFYVISDPAEKAQYLASLYEGSKFGKFLINAISNVIKKPVILNTCGATGIDHQSTLSEQSDVHNKIQEMVDWPITWEEVLTYVIFSPDVVIHTGNDNMTVIPVGFGIHSSDCPNIIECETELEPEVETETEESIKGFYVPIRVSPFPNSTNLSSMSRKILYRDISEDGKILSEDDPTIMSHGPILSEYDNGNSHVKLYLDGTKIIDYPTEEILCCEFPNSIDLKITDRCASECPYCHESSSPKGEHANPISLALFLQNLHPGVEVAIGGGNPLLHPNLKEILFYLAKDLRLVVNLTVSASNIESHPKWHPFILELMYKRIIRGLGLSLDWDGSFPSVKLDPLIEMENTALHLILGIHSSDLLIKLAVRGYTKFVLLGAKRFGNCGPDFEVTLDDTIINRYISAINSVAAKECIIGFDTLAISQLKITPKYPILKDGQQSMYVDAVTQTIAKNSTTPMDDRIQWDKKDDINKIFRSIRDKV
jgi:hypothetical protein